MSRLSRSVYQASALLADADLSDENVVRQLLELTYARRRMDLTDLSPAEHSSLMEGLLNIGAFEAEDELSLSAASDPKAVTKRVLMPPSVDRSASAD